MRLIIRDVEAASSSLATPMDGNSCVSRGSFFRCSFPVQLIYSESSFAGFLISVCLFRLMHPLFLGAAKAVHGLAVIPAGIMVWMIAAGVSAIIAKTPLSKVLLGVKQ